MNQPPQNYNPEVISLPEVKEMPEDDDIFGSNPFGDEEEAK